MRHIKIATTNVLLRNYIACHGHRHHTPSAQAPTGVLAIVTVPREKLRIAKAGRQNPQAIEAAPVSRDHAPKPVVTARRPNAAASLPPGLLPDTPEEHRRRVQAAAALWGGLVRHVREEQGCPSVPLAKSSQFNR